VDAGRAASPATVEVGFEGTAAAAIGITAPQQCLYRLPLPQPQGSLREGCISFAPENIKRQYFRFGLIGQAMRQRVSRSDTRTIRGDVKVGALHFSWKRSP
jgi:hypothetical protein